MFTCSKCGWKGETGKAWKVHCSRKHGSYSEKEWLAAARNASGEAGAQASGFGSFAEAAESAPSSEGAAQEKQAPGAELASRFSEMKGRLGVALGTVFWAPLESWLKLKPLTEPDKKILAEGWQAALDCLDIQPEVEPISIRPRSRLLLLLFPVISMLIVLAQNAAGGDLMKLLEALSDGAKSKRDHRDHRAEGERENPSRNEPRPEI